MDGEFKMSSEKSEYASDIVVKMDGMMSLIDNELEDAYEKYAKAKSLLQYLQGLKGGVLSECMEDFDGSETKKKRLAEMSPKYKEFIKNLAKAVGDEQLARGRVEFLKIKIDALRTSISLGKSLI